jgi:sugar/nucleoside kinase (ribokinase family)
MTREQLCQTTSRRLVQSAAELSNQNALVGFDGFVDEIVAVVDKRHDRQSFQPVRTIEAFSKRIAAAQGQSANCELVVQKQKLGGNGPIMANALAALGMHVTYLGNLGYPSIHPVFEEFASRADVHSIAEPAHTDALEFADGKLMLGKLSPLAEVSWPNLIERVGRAKIEKFFADAMLIGMVNWTMLPEMTQIWERLLAEIVPALPSRQRTVFVDLADPEKRTRDDLLQALQTLSQLQQHFNVTLGLNRKESDQVAAVLKLQERVNGLSELQQRSIAIRRRLNVDCVVIHPRQGAVAARGDETAAVEGPFVQQPAISTGAGDHFNAGFVVGQLLGCSVAESLIAGVANSGFYVRTATSANVRQLAEFIATLPAPEP